MIVIQAAGGLGNQMQQYALYRKFLSLGKDARLDVSWFTEPGAQDGVYAKRKLELNYFQGLPYTPCGREERERLLGKGLAGKLRNKLLPGADRRFQETGIYHPEIFDFNDRYLMGYWACESYYADILDRLREAFVFPESGDARNGELLRRMEGEEAVSIHIRRGDYLQPENEAMFGNICTEEYYEGAIRFVRERCDHPHFYLFSDDPVYAGEHYRGEEFSVVDWNKGEESFQDIRLMSGCRHNICANSTFSFWGARLNGHAGKLMLRPSIHKNTQKYEPERMHELWKNWILVDNKGKIV